MYVIVWKSSLYCSSSCCRIFRQQLLKRAEKIEGHRLAREEIVEESLFLDHLIRLLVPLVNTIQSILMYVISQEVVAGSLAFVDVVAIHMTSVGLYRKSFFVSVNRLKSSAQFYILAVS